MMKQLINLMIAPFFLLTLNGNAQELPVRIEAESFSAINRAATREGDGGTIVNKFDKGAWIRFDGLDFGTGKTEVKFRIGSGSSTGHPKLEVRLGDEKGKLLAVLDVKVNGWNKLGEQVLKIPLTRAKQQVTLVSVNGGIILNWFELL